MRYCLAALLLATIAGCPTQSTGGDDVGFGGGGFSGGGGGNVEPGCHSDDDCGGDTVCARDGECLPAADVRHISVTWTIAGAAASDTTCADEPNLEISFTDELDVDDGDGFGFAPVPCNEGKFSVDKMPTHLNAAELGNEDGDTDAASGSFDGSGNLTLDIPSS
jgi:hypothetical protein